MDIIDGVRLFPRRLSQSEAIQTLLAFVLKLGAGAASYVLFALAARVMSPIEFGIFSILFSAAMLFGFAGSFGQQIFLVKEIPNARTRNEKEREAGAYKFSFLITFLFAIIAAVVLFALYIVAASTVSTTAILFGAFVSLLFALSQTTVGALRVQGSTLMAVGTRDLLWRVLAIIALLVLSVEASASGRLLDSGMTLAVLAVTLLMVVILHISIIARRIRREFKGIRPSFELRRWIETSSGLALVAIISSADLYLYTIVLGFVVPPEDVGVFFAALKTVELLNLFLMAVTLIVAPGLSTLVAKRATVMLQRKCNTAIVLQSIPVLLSTAIVMLGAPWLMWVFDPSFADSANVLRLLAFGMLVNALTGATGLLLQLGGLHWRQVGYQGGSLLVAVAMLPILVSWFGIMGAAVSFLVSKVLWNFLAIIAIRRKLGIDPSLIGLLDQRAGGLSAALDDIRHQVRISRRSANEA